MYKPLISAVMSGSLIAATPTIGTVKSNGDFKVDGSIIRGNTTVFDGSLVETVSARSVLELGSARITMLPESRAVLHRGRVVLEKGTSLVKDADKDLIEADTLRISPLSKGSQLQIEASGPNKVTVVARGGSAEVHNSAGILVARVDSGHAMQFDPQADATKATKMAGVLKSTGGKYLLTNDTANVTVEIRGKEIAKFVDKKVGIVGRTISGVTPAAGATQVVEVAGIGLLSAEHLIPGAGLGVGIGAVAVVAGVAVVGVAAANNTSAATNTTGVVGGAGTPPTVSRP